MKTKRFEINKDTLFEDRNEQYALVYDDTHYHNHSVFDERGNWEYISEKHIYEQVEYFNDLYEMNKRQIELSKITNKTYNNFRVIHNKS